MPSCSAGAEEISDGLLEHLHARDTAFVVRVAGTTREDRALQGKRGWTFPWFSSNGIDFNYDFHVTMDGSVAPIEYNYRTPAEHERRGT